MKSLTVTLRQPTQLSTSLRSDGVIDTIGHVPGWVVRGALAAAWIRTYGSPEQEPARGMFLRLFEGGVRFGPLYAADAPPPLSVHRHKYSSDPSCTTAYLDAAASADLQIPYTCGDCGQEWVPLRPGLSHEARHLRTSVAIDSTSQTAIPKKLFSRRRLRPRVPIRDAEGRTTGQITATFCGEVNGDDDLVVRLAKLRQVRLGGRKTSHGAVTIRFGVADSPQLWVRDDGLLVFALSSPGVFVDAAGRPTNAPSDGELSNVLGCEARVVKAWTRWDTVGGWHGASGLPKPTETVVTAGSTFAVKLADPLRADLAALVARGVGLRRHEGFGHIGSYRVPAEPAEAIEQVLRMAADVGPPEGEEPFPEPIPEEQPPDADTETQRADADVEEHFPDPDPDPVSDEELLPFVAFRYANGIIPADLAAAIRAAKEDASLVTEVAMMAKSYGGAFTGARDAKKIEQIPSPHQDRRNCDEAGAGMTGQNYVRIRLGMLEAGGVARPAPMRANEADLVVDTDHRGMPHLPATSFAGALRQRVRDLHPGKENDWFGFVQGDQSQASGIWVLGSRLVDATGALLTEPATTSHVTTTAIDRHTGAAAVRTLRTTELLPAGTRFEIYLRWDGDVPLADLVGCLSGWAPLVGRSTSTGHGLCQVEEVHTGTLDLATESGLRTWLTTSGPDLVRVVADKQERVKEADTAVAAYTLTFRTKDGPLAFSLDSDGNLPASQKLPGASIKGVIRSRMEYILRSVGLLDKDACGGVGCGKCLVCKVFGHSAKSPAKGESVGQRASLRVHDALVAGVVRERSHAPLDRWTGGVAMASKDEPKVYVANSRGGLLHTFEGIEEGQFVVEFQGHLPPDVRDGFEALLTLVLADIDDGLVGFGRATTRGYGSATVTARSGPHGAQLPSREVAQEWVADALARLSHSEGALV